MIGILLILIEKQKVDDFFHGIIILKEIYEKALKKARENMSYLNRTFPYITEDYLCDTIAVLYPDLKEIFNINLDERDNKPSFS